MQTLIVNWDYVGGSRGIYIIRPAQAPLGGGYIQYLYPLMMVLASSRSHRPHGRALATRARLCRDPRRRARGRGGRRPDAAAEADRDDPVRRADGHGRGAAALLRDLSRSALELQSCLCCQQRRDAGDRRNDSWVGPIIGAVILGTIQQLATVTISSALNLLIVGLLLIGFVIIAPNGIMGLIGAAAAAPAREAAVAAAGRDMSAAETADGRSSRSAASASGSAALSRWRASI